VRERGRGVGDVQFRWSDGDSVDFLSGNDPAKYIGAGQRTDNKVANFRAASMVGCW
jgi:hypothetical protein